MEKYNEVKDKIPLLRFRNFQQCKSWNKGTIDSIIECESSQLTLGKLNLSDKGYPIYGADGIIGYITFYNKSHMYISIVKDGSGVGRLNLCQAYSSLLGTLNYLFSKDEKAYQIQWIYYLLQTIDFSNYIKGSGIPHIYFNDYKKHIIYIPSFDEQREIADCLSSLDELIEATAQKVETLKEHKKGLMQRLFPAKGKNVPDLRFPEFRGTSAWEEKRLGDVVEIKGRIGFRGYTTKDVVEQGDGAISLSPTNITDNGNLNFEKSTYISWEKYEESPEIQLKKGYIVLVKTGSSYGKSALVKELPTKTTVNPQIVVLKPKDGINEHFISALISHSMVQRQIKCAVVGGAIPTLSQESISKFDILYPKKTSHKPSEQEKIADCLSSLDELIEATSRKVEIFKEHKKGLMQQLFPKI